MVIVPSGLDVTVLCAPFPRPSRFLSSRGKRRRAPPPLSPTITVSQTVILSVGVQSEPAYLQIGPLTGLLFVCALGSGTVPPRVHMPVKLDRSAVQPSRWPL